MEEGREVIMKKLMMIGLILLTVVLSSGTASAWRVFVAPPLWVGPPASTTQGTILRLFTMGRVTLLAHTEFGFQATGD